MAISKALLLSVVLTAISAQDSTTIPISDGLTTTYVLPTWPPYPTGTVTSVTTEGVTTTTIYVSTSSSPSESAPASESSAASGTPGGPIESASSTGAVISSYVSSLLSQEHSATSSAQGSESSSSAAEGSASTAATSTAAAATSTLVTSPSSGLGPTNTTTGAPVQVTNAASRGMGGFSSVIALVGFLVVGLVVL